MFRSLPPSPTASVSSSGLCVLCSCGFNSLPPRCHPERSEGSVFPGLISLAARAMQRSMVSLSNASRLLSSLFCEKSRKTSALFSYSCALFKKQYSHNFFRFNEFHALSQNTASGTLLEKVLSVSCTPSQKRALTGAFLVALLALSQPTENATTSNPTSANLDAASSISPLLATLTKNTRGVVSPQAKPPSLFSHSRRPSQNTYHACAKPAIPCTIRVLDPIILSKEGARCVEL